MTLFGDVLTAAAIAVPAARAEETVLWMGCTGGTIEHFLPRDLFGTPDSFLGGAFRNHQFTVIDYPSSLWRLTEPIDWTLGQLVDVGTANLVAAALRPIIDSGYQQFPQPRPIAPVRPAAGRR